MRRTLPVSGTHDTVTGKEQKMSGMPYFIIGFIVMFVLTKAIMHPIATLKRIVMGVGGILLVCGFIACLIHNVDNGLPCMVYGTIILGISTLASFLRG